MTGTRTRVFGRAFVRAALTAFTAMMSLTAAAATTVYEYDALGRLRVVTHDNRIVTTYTLDPAGNRTELTDVPIGPTSAPSSISVPATNTTGDYVISWGAATGTVLTYQLFESTNTSFVPPTPPVQNNASRAATFTNKPNTTTFYYRVRACANTDCSSFTTGGNGVTISIPPPSTPSITVPSSSSTGNYSITWSAASGSVQTYELYESTSLSSWPTTPLALDTPTSRAFTGKAHGSTYYYRVRACGRGGCSAYATGASGVTTTIPPPSAPGPSTIPATNYSSSYSVSFGTSTGSVSAYEIYESTSSSFLTQILKYSGTSTSATINQVASGTYYYRARACGVGGCSGYRTGANGIVVTLPPAAPTNLRMTHAGNCWWRAEWNAVSGAANYVVRDTVGNEQPVVNPTANVTCPLGNQNAIKPRWVKACTSAGSCSTTVLF